MSRVKNNAEDCHNNARSKARETSKDCAKARSRNNNCK
jgi:hypothetical protein